MTDVTHKNEHDEDEDEVTLEDIEADLTELSSVVDAIMEHSERLARGGLTPEAATAELTETIAPLLRDFSATVHDILLGLTEVISSLYEPDESELPVPNVGLTTAYAMPSIVISPHVAADPIPVPPLVPDPNKTNSGDN